MHDDKIDFEQFLSFKYILGIVCEMHKSAVAFKSVQGNDRTKNGHGYQLISLEVWSQTGFLYNPYMHDSARTIYCHVIE
jgi:hypothetical protein